MLLSPLTAAAAGASASLKSMACRTFVDGPHVSTATDRTLRFEIR